MHQAKFGSILNHCIGKGRCSIEHGGLRGGVIIPPLSQRPIVMGSNLGSLSGLAASKRVSLKFALKFRRRLLEEISEFRRNFHSMGRILMECTTPEDLTAFEYHDMFRAGQIT